MRTRTWHIRWAGQISAKKPVNRATDSELAEVVRAPALDPTPRHDGTRVSGARGDGNSGGT